MTEALAVLIVFALLGGVIILLRKRGAPILRSAEPRQLETVERLRLGPGHTVHLLRVGDRRLLIATFGNGCALLADAGSAAVEGGR
jgi:flagellar biogenesis protein FliO